MSQCTMGWKSPCQRVMQTLAFFFWSLALCASLPAGAFYPCSAHLSLAANLARPLPLLFSLLAPSPCDPLLQLLRDSP